MLGEVAVGRHIGAGGAVGRATFLVNKDLGRLLDQLLFQAGQAGRCLQVIGRDLGSEFLQPLAI